MIQMRMMILLLLVFYGLSGIGIAGDEAAGYSQTYIVFIDGSRAGKETVTEKIDENGDRIALSENEIYLSDGIETKRMAYSTRMILDGDSLKPKSYVYGYTTGGTGDSFQVSVEGDEITRTLNRGGQTSVLTTEFKPDTIILDFNVYHQYDYVLHKYDHSEGGRQVYSDFIPVIGSHIPVALTFLGESETPYRNGSLTVKNYQVEFVGLRSGTVSFDSNGRLIRLVMPDQELEVVREDILPANR